jgi:hypothetical protein
MDVDAICRRTKAKVEHTNDTLFGVSWPLMQLAAKRMGNGGYIDLRGGHFFTFGDYTSGVRKGQILFVETRKRKVSSKVSSQRDQPTNHPSNPPNQPTSQKNKTCRAQLPRWGESTKAQAS